MARKTKRRQPARPQRPAARAQGTGPASGAATSARPAQAARAAQANRVGGDSALVRSVEMSLAPGNPAPTRRGSSRIVLSDADPAIPLDRVPYFITDLVRLGLVVVAMLALLIVGALVVIPLAVR